MRTKEEILEAGGISNANMLSLLELEVLIDIRDQFAWLNERGLDLLGSIHDRLIDINSNLPFGG